METERRLQPGLLRSSKEVAEQSTAGEDVGHRHGTVVGLQMGQGHVTRVGGARKEQAEAQ